jgi:lysophospholipase L1-like esterase
MHCYKAFYCFILLLLACSSSTPELKPLSADAVILAFGDSLTYGKGVSEDDSYPEVLQGLTGRTVINDGISGSVTSEGLARLPASLSEFQPSLVIICYGGNDILRNQSLDKAKQNIAKMIELVRSSGAEVVLVGVPKKSLMLASLPLYQELAEQYHLPLENNILADLLSDNSAKSDSVHLNEKGYRLMAEAIFKLLQKAKAL